MSAVDDRIVNMRFNNSTFERAAKTTMGTLEKLKASLNFSSSQKGLNDLQSSASRFSLGNIGTAVEGVSKKFLALSTVAITALANITNRAINAGAQLIKSLTIAPIMDGFREYETNMNSIQTILANTKDQGSNLQDVNKALNQLNHYSDKTIYNFSEMARNIGTFTAAGVDLKTSVSSIKGIANLAAISGSSSQQASTAMYQLSQAIAAGQVHLQDWNSVVNAGMGGAVFQKALLRTAQNMGTIGKNAVKTIGPMHKLSINGMSFRESMMSKPGQESWLSSEVLTNTLKQFSGDMTVAQLKAQGFTKAQIKAIRQMGAMGVEAATKVKTMTQLMDTLKEAVGSGWGRTFQLVLGNFSEAKTTFTAVSNTLGGFIQASAKARNKVLQDWKALGGRTALIDGIKNAFHALISVVKPIKDAFRDIFPRTTGKQLYDLTVRFRDFMQSLKIGDETANNLKRTFKGFFALLDIGKQIISGVFHVIGSLFGALGNGSGSFLNLTGNMGDFLVSVDQALKKGGALTSFFDKLGNILATPIALLGIIAHAISGLFDGFNNKDATGMSDALGRVNDRMQTLSNFGDKIQEMFNQIGQKVQPVVQNIANAFHNLGDAIAKSLKSGNFNQVLDALNTGLLAGIVILIKKFFSKGISVDFGGGIFKKVGGTLDALTGKMEAMQAQIKAKTLLMIAGAIGILTASVVALSLIDSAALTKALKAMAVGFGELLGSMAILTKITGSAGFIKVPVIAGSMILLAGAITLLTVAVRNLAKLSWDELKKGLVGVAALLGAISLAVIPLSKNSAGMIRVGIGLTGIAIALNLLYLAVKGFSSLSWSELGKGLAAVAGSLVAIAAGMRAMPKNLALQGAGLLAISVALNALYLAVKGFSSLSWEQMGKGLAAVAGSLLAIAVGMRAMPKGMIAQAAALVVVSLALLGIGKAVAQMGSLDWGTIGKGLATLAGALGVLALGLKLMSSSLTGAAALLVVSGALALLVPVLIGLGNTPWQVIAIGLGAIAAAFAIFGAAGLLLAPVTPVLIGLGVAFVAFGAALALAGVGVLAIGKGLGYLAEAGSKAIKILAGVLETFIKKLPDLVVGLAKGVVEFIKVLGKNAPAIGKALGQIIEMIIKVLVDNIPKIVQAAIDLVLALAGAIRDNLPKIIKVAADIIIAFLKGIGDNIGRIVDAGFKLVIKFLNGLADAIRNNLGTVIKAAFGVGTAIIQGIWEGMSSIFSWIWGKISGFFSWLWDKIKGWFGISSPSKKMAEIGLNLIKGLWQGITGAASWVWGKISGFFTKLWDKITNIVKQVAAIGKKIVKTLWDGWWGLNSWLWDKAKDFILSIFDKILNILGRFANIGSKIVRAIWDGISGLAGWIFGRVVGFIGSMWNKIIGAADRGYQVGVKIVKGIWSGISYFGAWIRDKFTGWFRNIWYHIQSWGSQLYDIGANIVKGIWEGIKALGPWLWNQVKNFFGDLWGGIKGLFGIHSPSTLMAWMGQMMIRGLGKGIADNTKTAVDASNKMGDKVIDSLSKTLSKTPRVLSDIDVNPRITPVLDLSNVRKNAGRINGMLQATPIDARMSFGQASSISVARQRVQQDEYATSGAAPSSVTFEQNNYSPKALSSVDIYRQTKNQLAMAKKTLGVS